MVASAFLVAISIVAGKYLAIRGGDVLHNSSGWRVVNDFYAPPTEDEE